MRLAAAGGLTNYCSMLLHANYRREKDHVDGAEQIRGPGFRPPLLEPGPFLTQYPYPYSGLHLVSRLTNNIRTLEVRERVLVANFLAKVREHPSLVS